MLILNINLNGDPAAVGENLVRAINKYTDHTARHLRVGEIKTISNFIDIIMDDYHYGEIKELVESADILHFNQLDWMHSSFEKYRRFIHDGQRVVFHGHGGSWLLNPEPQIKRCREIGAKMVVCGPMDEYVLGKENGCWIPNILPNDETRQPDWNRDFNGELIVGLSANHSGGIYKGAEMIRYMVEYLGFREHKYPVRFELIIDKEIKESIVARKHHHFTVDNWVQGFGGMASLEGLALGHVVFCRFDHDVEKKWKKFAPEMIPIINVKGFDTCAAKIREYCNDRKQLEEHSKVSREWIEKYYSEKRILKLWTDLYESLAPIKCRPKPMMIKSDSVIVELFDEVATREKPLGGIMGNEKYDKYERDQIFKLFQSLDVDVHGKILDAGAGIGRNITVLKKLGFKNITAVDFSGNMLEKLHAAHPDVKYYESDLANLNQFKDNEFDVTLCFYVMIHIVDDVTLSKVVSELERITKGLLIIGQVMDAENKPNHRVCRVREYFELHPFFKKKKLEHFYKNLYEFPAPDGSAMNKVSFAIFK